MCVVEKTCCYKICDKYFQIYNSVCSFHICNVTVIIYWALSQRGFGRFLTSGPTAQDKIVKLINFLSI